ncbi:putative nucleoside-diphosphate-sugar epimerase [Pseudovirgaria hyperparasitica]|uniref:Putative nucleoside-diphosphate-sugar epimerase n=1 Tax=Pseudovirgaria hyperparasitica TaxID=470096 RepID=A0A6A6WKB5_9PEZI|nr:putative nucleoside-diphosphate-sugar epimerase [Pseudovirgaria hyperparasitica]KAF2762614.1 putative nucleoside-diphosphate-sugar epimerase [Pseudovirgaria hyperparasitica]
MSHQQPTYLITGATGSLGGAILTHLLTTQSIPASQKRERQHRNVVEAVVEAAVGHTFYASLAIGGAGESKTAVMAAHLMTERMLKESGAMFTSVREGVYANCFPVFLNWYPTNRAQRLRLPADGKIAWAVIDELGEATAKLMVEGGREKETVSPRMVLLSGAKANSFSELVEAINSASGRSVSMEIVSTEEYISLNSSNDEGEKPIDFFRHWSAVYDELATGGAAETSTLLAQLLGREPKSGVEWIIETLRNDPEYTWHQQYMNRGPTRT